MKKIIILCLLLTSVLLLSSGCIPGDGTNTSADLAGFFWGFWHGLIAPVSLVISFFNDQRSMYEVYNVGFLYNLGFLLAIITVFSGGNIISINVNRKVKIKGGN